LFNFFALEFINIQMAGRASLFENLFRTSVDLIRFRAVKGEWEPTVCALERNALHEPVYLAHTQIYILADWLWIMTTRLAGWLDWGSLLALQVARFGLSSIAEEQNRTKCFLSSINHETRPVIRQIIADSMHPWMIQITKGNHTRPGTQNHLRSTSRLYSAWYPSLDTHNCWNRQVRSDPTRSSLVLYSRRTLNIHRKLSAISVNLVLWNHSHKLMTTKEETTRLACGWLIYLISKCFTLFFNSVWFVLCLDK